MELNDLNTAFEEFKKTFSDKILSIEKMYVEKYYETMFKIYLNDGVDYEGFLQECIDFFRDSRDFEDSLSLWIIPFGADPNKMSTMPIYGNYG